MILATTPKTRRKKSAIRAMCASCRRQGIFIEPPVILGTEPIGKAKVFAVTSFNSEL
jgi:hypothetical protein